MAFPVIAATNTTDGTTASAAPVVNLPADIAAGNLLLVLFRTAIGTLGVTWPVGAPWQEMFDSTADASDDATSMAYRWADGTEGATITLATSSAKFAALSWRITGAENPATQPPTFNTAIGASATPDPPNHAPGVDLKDFLWLWCGGWEGEQTSPPASNPTDYTLHKIGANSGVDGTVPTNCRVASAARELTGLSQNPGIWTISASDQWTTATVAIHPPSTFFTVGVPPYAPAPLRAMIGR